MGQDQSRGNNKIDFKTARRILSESKKILIILNNQASYDTHAAAAAFFLSQKENEKNISLCVNGELITKQKKLFERFEIEHRSTIRPLNYVIALDHAGGSIEKVKWDDKDGKFFVYITPAEGSDGFDFDNVSYSYGGGDYDAIFTFGARSLNWFGDLYKKNKPVFERAKLVNINNLSGAQEYGDVKVVKTGVSVSEIVYDLIERKSKAEKVTELLATGLVDYLQLLHRSKYNISTVEVLLSLVRSGADLKKVINELYYKRSLGNFKVIQKLMNNLRIDKKVGLAWSGVSTFDINQSGIDRDSFILDGRIIFNVSEAFKVAFAMYEVSNEEVWVELESNQPELNAKELVSDFRPSGNTARAVFWVDGKSMAQVEQEILVALKEKLGVAEIVPDTEIKVNEKTGSDKSEGESKSSEEEGIPDVAFEPPVELEDSAEESSKLTEDENKDNNGEESNGESNGHGPVPPPPVSPTEE